MAFRFTTLKDTEGKKCRECGSEFGLTKHHYLPEDKAKPRNQKSNKTQILCETCHTLKDFKVILKCYYESKERKYNIAMDNWERRWAKQEKKLKSQ